MKSIPPLPRSFSFGILLLVGLIAFITSPASPAAAPADLTVESPADGKTFKLSEAKGKYVALHFLLKTECPFCLKHTRDYAKKSASAPDVIHVFIKPDSADEIKAWSTKANRGDDFADVTIYRDADANLADQFGIPGGYQFHGQRTCITPRSCCSIRRARKFSATSARAMPIDSPMSSSPRSWLS